MNCHFCAAILVLRGGLILCMALSTGCATSHYGGSGFPVYFKLDAHPPVDAAKVKLFVIPDTTWQKYQTTFFVAGENFDQANSDAEEKQRRAQYLILNDKMDGADFVPYDMIMIVNGTDASFATYTPHEPGETTVLPVPLPTPFAPKPK